MTLRKRPFQILLLSLTIFALFVSAVSACACSHHQTAAVEEMVSCHTSKHETAPAVEKERNLPRGTAIGVDCDCLVRLPVPAVSAKSEKKAFKQSADPDSVVEVKFDRLTAFFTQRTSVSFIDRLTDHHSPPELFSGPSRAPPRL